MQSPGTTARCSLVYQAAVRSIGSTVEGGRYDRPCVLPPRGEAMSGSLIPLAAFVAVFVYARWLL
jgi:hypothetical protein